MVAEPALDLNCIAAFREKDGGAGVTEGVEADPRKVCGLPSGLEHSPEDVVWHERRPVGGREYGVLVIRPLCSRVVLVERRGEQRIE